MGKYRPPKKGILLVAFGTRVPEARVAFETVDRLAKSSFPDVEIRWAYTSRTVRANAAATEHRLNSPESALALMMDEGFTDVAVLSLHVIPGREFHDLARNAALFAQMANGFNNVVVARPLLSSFDDMTRVANIMLDKIPSNRKPEDAVLYMGHGSGKHPSDAVYPALNYILGDLASNVFLATVDGNPTLADVLPKLLQSGVRKVYLLPFMAVAGIHIRSDMAGDKPESWKSILSQNGFACETSLTGMAEYPEIIDVWLDHLRDAHDQLEQASSERFPPVKASV